MASSFDPKEQFSKTESKIVVALERISEAFRVLLWQESKENALSPIQTQLLIFLLFHSKEKCRVSYLANEFNMTKATISDSIKILLQKKLIEKAGNELDTRSFVITLTVEGEKVAQRSSAFANAIETPVAGLSELQKSVMLEGLMQLIKSLNKAGVITVQRMCYNCRFYNDQNNQHYCQLLQQPLEVSEIKTDCLEHEPSALRPEQIL